MTLRSNQLFAILKHGLLGASLALLPLHPVSGQKSQLPAEYYALDDGLSDRLINDITQDEQGFVWIATPNGLNRFDGYEFITFNNHPDNEFAISGSSVQEIAKDEQGNLVLFYQNNKVSFDILNPRTNEFRKISLSLEDGIRGFVRSIHVNRTGQIFVLSIHDDGTHLYRCHSQREDHLEFLFRIPEVHSSVSPSIDMVQLSDGSFLINDSELGLRLFSVDGALLKSFDIEDFECLEQAPRYPSASNIMHQDAQGGVWLSLTQAPGIFRFNQDQRYLEQVASIPTDQNITHLWEDQAGNILLAQSEIAGTYYENTQMHCIRPDGSVFDFTYLTDISPRIQCAYAQDFFKTIFLGMDTGLSVIQNNRSKIKNYLAQDLHEFLRGNLIRGIDGDDRGTVYFASERNGWYALDLVSDSLDTLRLIDEKTGRPLDLNCSNEIHLDDEGYLWGISCSRNRSGRLHRLHLEWDTVRTYNFPYEFTTFLQSRRDSLFWLLCQPDNEKGMLVFFNPQTGRFNIYRDLDGRNPLKNSTPHYILEGKEGMLWIGTDNGLFCVDRSKRSTRIYRSSSRPDNQLEKGEVTVDFSSNTIFVIHQDSNQRLWLGTDNGLSILDPESGAVQILDKRNGLASNMVCGIVPDQKGHYWISTYNGLSYYEPDRQRFRSFYKEDGFSHDEFNRFSFHRDENGRYYFGGVNGLNVFYAEDLLVNDPPPPVVFTRLSRYNSRSDSLISNCTPLCETDKVTISPYDIYFQFNFMLPSFSNPHKNQFSAWLEGYEKDWIYLGNSPNIRYSKLPPGDYTLHLTGADPNGNWNQHPISIDIQVKPIFYKTYWFMLTMLGILIAVIYGWLKYRLEQKLKVERLRTKLSSDLHDEVSGLLSGIAMQTDVMQEIVSDEISRSKLKAIGEISRKAMSKMSDVIWSIDSRNDRVSDLLTRMHEHAEEILTPLSVDYRFHIVRLDRNIKTPVKIRQELYFIFKETINNIAKHSNATRVDIYLVNDGQEFEMRVHDNGNSQSKVNGKTGQGLANIRMRAQRIKAQLHIFNGNGFTVQLKMKKFT